MKSARKLAPTNRRRAQRLSIVPTEVVAEVVSKEKEEGVRGRPPHWFVAGYPFQGSDLLSDLRGNRSVLPEFSSILELNGL